jgi:hypothetical protein
MKSKQGGQEGNQTIAQNQSGNPVHHTNNHTTPENDTEDMD